MKNEDTEKKKVIYKKNKDLLSKQKPDKKRSKIKKNREYSLQKFSLNCKKKTFFEKLPRNAYNLKPVNFIKKGKVMFDCKLDFTSKDDFLNFVSQSFRFFFQKTKYCKHYHTKSCTFLNSTANIAFFYFPITCKNSKIEKSCFLW